METGWGVRREFRHGRGEVLVTDPTTAGLRAIAGPHLYRRNAFRITGVATDADRRTVRHRQQKVVTALEAGVDIDLDVPVELDEMRAAFERILGDPRLRLVDELFWLWDTDKASCGCPKMLHLAHDKAVVAHSAALDREIEDDDLQPDERDEVERLWAEAATMWTRVLRHDRFFDHVRHRIAALDDKQLNESVIGVLREELPMTLVRPMIRLLVTAPMERTWLAGSVRSWPVPSGAVDDLMEEAAEPQYGEIREDLKQASELLTAGRPERAGTFVTTSILPDLHRLETLVPPSRHRRTVSLRNDVSLLLNNCATVHMEQVGPSSGEKARQWLQTARGLTSDEHGKALIDQNLGTLDEMMTAYNAIRERVGEFVGMGRGDLAVRMLRDTRRRLGNAPGVEDIDKMLAELGDRRARTRLTAPPRPTRVRYRRPGRVRALFWAVVSTLFWGALGYGAYLLFFDGSSSDSPDPVPPTVNVSTSAGDTGGTPVSVANPVAPVGVRVYSERISDNAPVGTCIATRDGWDGDKTSVPSVPCTQNHWGEVLGYVMLGAVPSPYPGSDQAEALTHYHCAYLRKQQGLDNPDYDYLFAYPGQKDWNDGGKQYQNYATCVIHRKDDKPMPARQVTDPGRTDRNIAVTMDMYAGAIYVDPPVGVCVQDKDNYQKDQHAVSIVDCTLPHWGQIIGYPVLYQADKEPWPGDNAVYAKASDACLNLQREHGLDGTAYHNVITWPAQDAWQNATSDKRIYAVCTVTKGDDSPMTGPLN